MKWLGYSLSIPFRIPVRELATRIEMALKKLSIPFRIPERFVGGVKGKASKFFQFLSGFQGESDASCPARCCILSIPFRIPELGGMVGCQSGPLQLSIPFRIPVAAAIPGRDT